MKEFALTTFDNPFDPFTQFDEWHRFDLDHKHYCCEFLAMFTFTSDQLTDEENEREKERGIDEIIKYDPLNVYKKVFRNG